MARTYSYCTPDVDVRMLVKLVTDEVIDDDDIQYFIDKVDSYIDSRLARRYNVPFTQATAPPVLTDISSNLTTYQIIKRLKIETNDTEKDYARTFYNDGMRTLKEISTGKTEILDTDGNIIEPLSSTGIVSSTSDFEPTFNEGSELDWTIDDGKF